MLEYNSVVRIVGVRWRVQVASKWNGIEVGSSFESQRGSWHTPFFLDLSARARLETQGEAESWHRSASCSCATIGVLYSRESLVGAAKARQRRLAKWPSIRLVQPFDLSCEERPRRALPRGWARALWAGAQCAMSHTARRYGVGIRLSVASSPTGRVIIEHMQPLGPPL